MIDALPLQNSNAVEVVRVYEDACTRGKLVIQAEQGAIVKFSELPPAVRLLMQYDAKSRVNNVTYVKLQSPPSTYVVVRQLNATRPGMTMVSCRVISSQVDRQSAVLAMSTGMENVKVKRRWDWGAYQPFWNADDPKIGVRREVYDDGSGWIAMTTETYRTRGGSSGPQQKGD